MGKNYVESSLKRFLKRKVKITLGLVVAFMITGAVSFAGEEQKEIETAKKYLTGLGTEINLDKEITAGNVKISSDGAGGIKVTFADNKEAAVLKDIISAETGKVIQNSLNLINGGELSAIENEEYNKGFNLKDNGTAKKVTVTDKTGASWEEMQVSGAGNVYVNEEVLKYRQVAKDGAVIVNKNIIAHNKSNGQIIEEGIGYNYGIIANNGIRGQKIGGYTENKKLYGGIGYNYGIIANNGGIGQNIYVDKGINYGIIASNGGCGQAVFQGGEAINYGIIANNGAQGQASFNNDTDTPNKLINYGVIANNGSLAQQAHEKAEAINYGIINNSSAGDSYGQLADNGGKIENYGIIKGNTRAGQRIETGSEGYNYGIIESTGRTYSMETSQDKNAENYGVVKNESGVVFSTQDIKGGVDNYGIVILTADNGKIFEDASKRHGLSSGNNRGVVLTKDYELLDQEISSKFADVHAENKKVNGHVIDLRNENNKINSSTDKEETYYTKDKTAEFNGNLTNKVLNAVVTQEGTTAFKHTGENDLILNNSQIIGYFEKAGTLVEVGENLTLNGNSIINAIENNMNVDGVAAVKLANNGTLTLNDNSKVLGAVKGNGTLVFINNKDVHDNLKETDSAVIKTTAGETTNIALSNLKLKDSGTGVNNAGKLVIDNQSDKKLEGKNVSTSIVLGNNIDIEKGIDGSSSKYGFELTLGDGQTSSDKTINIDSITLGTENDVLTIKNILGTVGEINGNGGKDIVKLEKSAGDTFDYKLKNIDTLDLGNSIWKIGKNAEITNNTITKAEEKTTIQNGTLIGELKGTAEKGVDFLNNDAVNKVIGNSTFGENAKFQMNIGKDMVLKAGAEYDVEDKAVENLANNVGEKNITTSGIFTKADEQGKDIRVKTAEEMKIDDRYSGIYEEMLENASSNSEILDVLNSSDASFIANAINGKGALGDTLATTGYKITRDISNSFMSAVNEWDKKADKGEWLANAKYINSDVEYDGADKVKGYDSDIKSMAAMIEYGVSDNTSLGIALGGGDTEIEVKDAGTLKGDNYYIGAYAKHSVNGFDLTGNLGYTISDLEVNGEGSADSSAITLGGYIKRDITLTETVRLEPNLSFAYDYIMQDNAEENRVKVDNKDVHVFEAGAGMNIVKGFNFEKGLLELEAGVKYSMADVNRNEETVVSVYGIDNINLGNPEIDKTRGTAHIGFDYEHALGFGVNGKYEMMWSDSGDDSRITAGISYRF